jgi:hypothetical protein
VSSKPSVNGSGRRGLTRLFKVFAFVLIAGVAYVLLDFAIDLRPPGIHTSYRFELGDLAPGDARILRQDNLTILVVHRSPSIIKDLQESQSDLQDAASSRSRQPDYARNALRSRHAQYFVSYGVGTDLACPLQLLPSAVREICGSAQYDFAGRALEGVNQFPNLSIPDYTFDNNFSTLIVQP